MGPAARRRLPSIAAARLRPFVGDRVAAPIGTTDGPIKNFFKLEVSLDTSQYRPDELSVSVSDGVLRVEGKHEEKAEDGSKMVSRMFSRQYTLPPSTKQEEVASNLSSDGVLVITAPKKALAIK